MKDLRMKKTQKDSRRMQKKLASWVKSLPVTFMELLIILAIVCIVVAVLLGAGCTVGAIEEFEVDLIENGICEPAPAIEEIVFRGDSVAALPGSLCYEEWTDEDGLTNRFCQAMNSSSVIRLLFFKWDENREGTLAWHIMVAGKEHCRHLYALK